MMVQKPLEEALGDLEGVKAFITDPPYNLGFKYGKVDDKRSSDDYAAFVQDLVQLTFDAAADDAHMMVIHYPEHFAQHWETYTGNGWKFHQWLNWNYTGHTLEPRTKRLRRSHRAILWLTKGEPHFGELLRPYKNPNDKRIQKAIAEGSKGAKATDVFHVEQVKKGSSEHKGYANQIPEALLRDLVQLTTQPGDLVADPCAGTGSTIRTALKMDRAGWGCDANPEVVPFWSDLDTRQVLLIGRETVGGVE